MSTLSELKKFRNNNVVKSINQMTPRLTTEQLQIAAEDQLAAIISYSEQIDIKYLELARVQEQRSVAYVTESLDKYITLESDILKSIGNLFSGIWNAICTFFSWIIKSIKRLFVTEPAGDGDSTGIKIANVNTSKFNRFSLFKELDTPLSKYELRQVEFIDNTTEFEVVPGVTLTTYCNIEYLLRIINETVVGMTKLVANNNALNDAVKNTFRRTKHASGRYLVKTSFAGTTKTDLSCELTFRELIFDNNTTEGGLALELSETNTDIISVKLDEVTTLTTDEINHKMYTAIKVCRGTNMSSGIAALENNINKLYALGKKFEDAPAKTAPSTDPVIAAQQLETQKINKTNMVTLAKYMHINYGQIVALGVIYKNLLR